MQSLCSLVQAHHGALKSKNPASVRGYALRRC